MVRVSLRIGLRLDFDFGGWDKLYGVVFPVGTRCRRKRDEGRWSCASGIRHDDGLGVRGRIWNGFGFKVYLTFRDGSVGVRIRIWVG